MWPPARTIAIAIALAAGIEISAASGALATSPGPWIAAAALIAAAAPWRRAHAAPIACLAIATLLGAAVAAREHTTELSLPVGVTTDDRSIDTVTGIVVGPVTTTPIGTTLTVDVEGGDARVLVTVAATDALPGDRVRLVGRLRTPRGYRNPAAVDRAQVVGDRGGELELSTDEVTVIERDARASAWRWPVHAHRRAVSIVRERGGDAEGSAIVRGAVVGDRSAIPTDTDDAWRAAGIYHALSVSGLHLAVVAMLAFGFVRRAWSAVPALALRVDAARAAACAAAPLALAYTLITGGQTATLRALVVALAMLAAAALRRRLVVLDAVGLAAVGLLLIRPATLHDPSFQLSFVAAVTLCACAGGRREELDAAPRGIARCVLGWVGRVVLTSCWVTATTAPITAWHFHEVAVGGLLGNIVLAPVVELLVIPSALLGITLESVGSVGGALIDLAIFAAACVDDGARVISSFVPVLEIAPPRPIEIAAWYAWLAAVWAWRRTVPRTSQRRLARVVVALSSVLAVTATLTTRHHAAPDGLRVTFLDVGQGDAAVVELPDGEVWLVDAGGTPIRDEDAPTREIAERRRRAPGEAIRRFLADARIDRIDVVIISHAHPDHYLGLLALAGRVEIGELWSVRPPPGEPPVTAAGMPTFEDVAAALARHGTRRVHPRLGAHRRGGGVVVDVLAPVYDDGTGPAPVAAADPVRTLNDDSLVVAFELAGRRVLFLGDIEREGEDRLVASGGARADVVKVAHHGSATSSTAELVAATGARWAVVSCGRMNRFGFPAADVVSRWRGAAADVLRTDLTGAVTVSIAPSGAISIASHD